MLEFALAISFVVLVAGTIGLLFFGSKIKRLALRGLTGEFRRASVEEFSGISLETLRQTTAQLEAIGFTWIADFAVVRPKPQIVSGFSRLLFNRDLKCSATVIQVFSSQNVYLRTHTVMSSRLEDNWSIGTTNFSPLAASAVMRHRRIIGQSLPAGSMAEILAANLELRDRVAGTLNLQVLSPDSFESHIGWLKKQSAERREMLERKSALACAVQYFRSKFWPTNRWLGDYLRLAAKRATR